ncbi:MAG: hypothetical protein E7514_06315 [Ruminococcaceae bacterium]|nr:hypothetical protein [Oscillospiraceae bacterium]
MRIITELLLAAVYALVLQNFIFTGGYGASEAIRMAAKPKQLYVMSFFITVFSTSASVICVILEQIRRVRMLGIIGHAIIFILVLAFVYIIALIVIVYGLKAKQRTRRRLGIAAFNTLVLAVPFLNYRAGFSVPEAIGSGIGSGLAFALAAFLINLGLQRLQKSDIPDAFKGTPAIFIYVAMLSLGFAGILGTL